MKLFALAGGSRMGNTEILIKEALMGAEERGAEVEMMRILDLDIKHCNACWPCPVMFKGPSECIRKDDGPFVTEKVLDCDGLLIGAPVYCITPPGYVIAVRDRVFGPRLDVSARTEMKKTRDAQGTGMGSMFGKMWDDERLYKKRVGGLISLGGAPLNNWVTLGLPTLHTITFPLQVEIVDQMDVIGVAEKGAVTLKDDIVARARRLGHHLAEAMAKPLKDLKWMGEEPPETCPVCHRNLMVFQKDSMQVECAICGVKGDIHVSEGKIDIVFSEEEQKKSRLTPEGKRIHFVEIGDVMRELAPHRDKIPGRVEKYKAYTKCIVEPPSKSKSKSEVQKRKTKVKSKKQRTKVKSKSR
jgi:multimeric flavodoxin WrbA